MGFDIGPESPGPETDALIRNILGGMRRIAVVGISDKPDRASHGIARFLAGNGFEVVGVNPVLEDVLGIKVYPTLADVPGPVDVVDVFRRSDAVPAIVDEAVARGDKAVWLQEGVVHEEAAAKAREAGLDVVMDRCIYKDWLRLMND
jgi:predicted CoA-binding protein